MPFFHDDYRGSSGGDRFLKWVTKNTPAFIIKGGGLPPVTAQVGKALLVFDYPTTAVGWVKYDGGFHVVAAPYRTPLIACPGPAYKPCVVFKTLVLGNTSILPWVVDASYPMNRMGAYFTNYEACPEAAEGKLPVNSYIGNDSFKMSSYPNDTFFAPTFGVADWMPRPPEFGPATVPPRPPELPESEVPTALPPPANDAAPAAYRPVPIAEPSPAANDLLAKFVRRQ